MKFIALSVISILLSAFASASDIAIEVRDEINLARTAPQQYAQILASHMAGYHGIEGESAIRDAVNFLQKARPLRPLVLSDGICSGALTHVLDLGPVGGRGHVGSGGTMPWDRMARFGRWSGLAGENIYYGERDARGIVIALIVDDGERSRAHRKNLFSPVFRYTGIACGPHASFGRICVIDFAADFVEGGTKVARPIASL